MPSAFIRFEGSRVHDDWNVLDREAINEWQIVGGMTWSFDMFRTRETLKERTVSYQRARTQQEQLVETILLEVSSAFKRLRRTEQEIEENRKAVKFRRETFKITKHRYNALLATYSETLEAERELNRTLGEYYESLIDYKLNLAQLERNMGVLLQ